MMRLSFAAIAAGVSALCFGADVEVDFGTETGRMLPLHGVCNSPLKTSGVQDTFRDAGIPFMRPHDACGAFGGAHYIDIPNLFPDFSKDEDDPASYDFALTDAYLGTVVAAGTEVFYRLGVTFEPQTKKIKVYNVRPPQDFAKWARICEHVIRHYTEGWADGKHWNIRYWEIWNEPETTSGWQGTYEQFFDFYRIASRHLKEKFPHLKVGGYAASGFYAAVPGGKVTEERKNYLRFFERFMAYVTAPETKCPLDFFSWHIYTLDPEEVAAQATFVRTYLDTHGFKGLPVFLNEWNRIDHHDPARAVRYWEEMKEAPGAAFVASVFCKLQRDRTVDGAMYYDAFPERVYCGLYYYPSGRPTPCWESLRKFNELYRLGTARAAVSHVSGVDVCAASDGTKKAILLANVGAARAVDVQGVGKLKLKANDVRLLTDEGDGSGWLEITRRDLHEPGYRPVPALEHCTSTVTAVEFTLRPTAESAIHARLLLPPADRWDGRFWGIGNCGYGHNLGPMNGLMLPRVHAGSAACIADMGTADGRFGREVIRDFGWRAAHLMAVHAKRLVAAHYGRPAKKNYFYGVSSGGGQGLHEAQRFPEDYDGIVSYVPAHYRTRHAVEGRAAYRAGKPMKDKGFMSKALLGPDATNEYDMDDAAFASFVDAIKADVDASSTDLDAFVKRGGKLMIVSGLADRIVPTQTARDYCLALADRYGGAEKLAPFFRAYFLPGRGHTHAAGPDGVEEVESLRAIVDWCEKGVAPGALSGHLKKGDAVTVAPWTGDVL